MSARSDLLLAQKAATGDLGAFDTLVRRYQQRIYRTCLNLLGDPHAAQDAAQDTFFTAWRSIGRFRGDATFNTWLYRIATNHCLKELKRRPPPPAELTDLPAADHTSHEQLEATERLAAITAALARLPVDQRAPLLLREVEGLTYNQIAEVVGVSMTAVKSRIYRARLELAQQLDGR